MTNPLFELSFTADAEVIRAKNGDGDDAENEAGEE